MTNEQREAIKICKEKIIESFYDFPNPTSIELKDTDVEAIEIALSLIKEQQEEIQKKDKQIDLMAFNLADYIMYYEYDKCRNPEIIKQKAEEIKKYYKSKSEIGE